MSSSLVVVAPVVVALAVVAVQVNSSKLQEQD
jgi:hypothetical protein